MAKVPNNYEINVGKKKNKNDEYGVHFCRIELPDHNEDSAEEKLEYLRKLFGDEFHVSMKYWKCSSDAKDGWK